MQDDTPGGNNLVPGVPYPGAEPGNVPASGSFYPDSFPAASRHPIMDASVSAKMTPQILFFLVFTGLTRHWRWSLPAGLIAGTFVAGVLFFIFPVRYEATAWIQVSPTKPYYIFDDKQQRDYQSFVNTQFVLMKSPLIIDRVFENPVVAQMKCVTEQKDRARWLASRLLLQAPNKSEMVAVSFETEQAQDAEVIVNSVIHAFFEYYDTQANDWNTRMIQQLTLELNRQQNAARLLQGEIRSGMMGAAQKGGLTGRDGTMAGGMGQGESLQRDLYLAEAKLEALKAELKADQELLREGPNRITRTMLQMAIETDPTLLSYAQQKVDIDGKLDTLRQSLKNPDDPQIVHHQTKLRQLEEKMSAYHAKMEDIKLMEIRRGMTASMEQTIWGRENAVRTQEIMVENLRERYKEQQLQAGTRTSEIAEVSFQQEQLKRINSVLDLLQTRIVSLYTEMNAPAQIQLRKKASLPREPKTRRKLTIVAGGGIVCFLLPFFLGVAIERLKPRLYHVSQIRMSVPDVIIGEIMEPPVSWVQGAMFRKRLARYKESVHNWCTHLLLSDPFRRCRSLALASVASDDGKTFLAVQIAAAMAQMREGKVLLIDGDMRVGRIHLLFGNEESGIGLADVLCWRNKFGEAVVQSEKEQNLEFLSAGHLDVSPYELLGDGRFRELLDMLERHYSLVLVVVPPAANAAESLIMSASCDSTLLCVRQGETILAAMEDVFRRLVNTGSSVDGIVVKDIPYYQMAGKDGGFADKLEQVRLAHLLQYSD